MAAQLSVVVGTLGRPHLARTLRSIVEQYPYQIVVVADPAGDLDHTKKVCDYFGLVPDECASTASKRGDDQKNHGMSLAIGTHIAFMDDDDEYTPEALAAMKERATDVPVIFRMEHPTMGMVWRIPKLEFANVGTPCFLVPNTPDKLGTWAPFIGLPDSKAVGGGDFHFISRCVEQMGGVLWDDRVVCRVRPI